MHTHKYSSSFGSKSSAFCAPFPLPQGSVSTSRDIGSNSVAGGRTQHHGTAVMWSTLFDTPWNNTITV